MMTDEDFKEKVLTLYRKYNDSVKVKTRGSGIVTIKQVSPKQYVFTTSISFHQENFIVWLNKDIVKWGVL